MSLPRKTARQRFKPLSTSLDTPREIPATDEELLAKYDRLIIKVAHTIQETYRLTPECGEDMAQCARIRLLRVPANKRHVAVWIRTVINNAMRTELKKIRAASEPLGKPMIYFDDAITVDGEYTDSTMHAEVPDPSPCVEATTERDQLARTAFAALNTEEQLVMALKLGLDGSQPIHNLRTLSRKSGVREARLPRVISRALAKMSEAARPVEKESAA